MQCYCNEKTKKDIVVKRGDIFYTDLGQGVGSEQGGKRPVIIIQNDVGNKYSPTVIVATITSKLHKSKLPTHIMISRKYGLDKDSIILLEQIRTLDKRRLDDKVGHADEYLLNKIDDALLISIGIPTNKQMNINKQINNNINYNKKMNNNAFKNTNSIYRRQNKRCYA